MSPLLTVSFASELFGSPRILFFLHLALSHCPARLAVQDLSAYPCTVGSSPLVGGSCMGCWAQRAGSDTLAPLLNATLTVTLQPSRFELCFHVEGLENWGKTNLSLHSALAFPHSVPSRGPSPLLQPPMCPGRSPQGFDLPCTDPMRAKFLLCGPRPWGQR